MDPKFSKCKPRVNPKKTPKVNQGFSWVFSGVRYCTTVLNKEHHTATITASSNNEDQEKQAIQKQTQQQLQLYQMMSTIQQQLQLYQIMSTIQQNLQLYLK